jgi:hypothetical protein
VATLNFTTTDRKTFTPISTAMANLRNATAGTMIVLTRQSALGATDFCGLNNSTSVNFFHALETGLVANTLYDDDDVGTSAAATWPQNTTDWYILAVDWSATNGSTENFHWRDQTTLGSFTNSTSAGTNNATAASAGTNGLFKIGYAGTSARVGRTSRSSRCGPALGSAARIT